MTDDTPEIEYSPLCEDLTRDGVTVRVEIYRILGEDESWLLEVVDQNETSIVWSETFATDKDASAEFYRTLEAEGIRGVLEAKDDRLH